MKKNTNKNVIWQLIIEITNMIIPLIASPIITRNLGAAGIGTYSYVFSIENYFAFTALLGIIQYGTREIASIRDNQEELNRVFSELLFLQIIIGSIVFVFYLVFIILFAKYKEMFAIEIAMFLGTSVLQISWLFSGLEDFKLLSIKNFIIRFFSLLAIVCFVKTPKDLYIYTIIISTEALLGAIVLFVAMKNKVSIVKFNIFDSIKHFRNVFVLFVPIIATYLYTSIDKIMLGNLSSMSQLGFYENAEKAIITKNISVAISVVLVPKMANLINKDDKNAFDDLLAKSMELVLILSIVFGAGTASISDVFSVTFWGGEFIECSPLIKIMSLTIPAYGLTYVVNNQLLVPLKKEKIFVFSTVFGALLNFILNIFLIPRYNAIGASFASLITQYFVLFLECYFARKYLKIIHCLINTIPYFIISSCMYIFVREIIIYMNNKSISLLVAIPIGGVFFTILCIIYWKVTKNNDYFYIMCRNIRIFKGSKK